MAKPTPRPPKAPTNTPTNAVPAPLPAPAVVAPPPAWWLPVTLVLYGLLALVYLTATPLQPITLPDNLPAARAQTPLTVGIGPDEKEHFLYIASLAERGKLPAQSPARRVSPDDFVSYEVQHPPLFFALAALLYKAFLPLLGVPGLWFVLRGVCALCGAGVVVLVHKTARLAFPDRPLVVWGAAPVCAFLPTFGHTMANLSNEPLASLIGAFLWYQIVRLLRAEKTDDWLRPALLLGATFGAGLITKLTIVVWLPALCIALVFWARKASQNPLLVFAAFGLPAVFCAAPWFGYLYTNFGTFAFRSHMRPLLDNGVGLLDYLQNPNQRLYPKNVPRGVVMPPSYLLLWGASTAIVPFWLVFAFLPGGADFALLWQVAFVIALLVPLLALGRHAARARSETPAYSAERALLWAGGSAMLMAVLTLMYQIFKVDWSMTNYGGRYTIAAWPAACLVVLFALSTLPEPGENNARRQRTTALVVASALLLLDLCAAFGVRAFYLANPTQPNVQKSEEVAFSASKNGAFS